MTLEHKLKKLELAKEHFQMAGSEINEAAMLFEDTVRVKTLVSHALKLLIENEVQNLDAVMKNLRLQEHITERSER